MQLSQKVLLTISACLVVASPVFADTTVDFDPTKMWECPQSDGSALYTNKELKGCTLLTLKELSVVPSLENMPTYVSPFPASLPRYDGPPVFDRYSSTSGSNQVPDWAKDWQASIVSTGSVQAEVCSMYGEWLHLTQKTRGGFFFGSDSSYGGDVTRRNQWGPSYSFYDNARYVALSKIFGQGFVPIGCL